MRVKERGLNDAHIKSDAIREELIIKVEDVGTGGTVPGGSTPSA